MPRKPVIPTPDIQKVDATSYNSVVGRTEMRGIRLLENRFEIKPEALEVDPSAWRKAVNFEIGEVVVTQDTGRLYGVLHYEVVCRHGRKRVLSATARYLVTYHVHGACSQGDGEVFIARVGRVAVYPYFRSLIATLVADAGVQMPPLPMMSLAPRPLASAAELVEPGQPEDARKLE
jgi:preprotein translocase subunit SecB